MTKLCRTLLLLQFALFLLAHSPASAQPRTADGASVPAPSVSGTAPYGKEIELAVYGQESSRRIANSANSLYAGPKNTISFVVVDRGQGRVALHGAGGFVSVSPYGVVSIRRGQAGDSETFLWSETQTGLSLISFTTHRYLCVDSANSSLSANCASSQGGSGHDARFSWKPVAPAAVADATSARK